MRIGNWERSVPGGVDVLLGLMLIICGLVLLAGSLYLIPAMGKYLEKMAKLLGGFQAIIGVISIIVAVIADGTLLGRVVLVIAGLILAAGVLTAMPTLGKYLAKITKPLGAFHTVIGIIAIIVGIIELI